MESAGLSYFTQQMLYQLPTLLAAILGVVLSVIFLRRYRFPAILALLGSGTVVISAFIVTLAQAYFFSARYSSLAMTSNTYVQFANIVGWIGAVVRGLSIALLVVAIFIGRKQQATTTV